MILATFIIISNNLNIKGFTDNSSQNFQLEYKDLKIDLSSINNKQS